MAAKMPSTLSRGRYRRHQRDGLRPHPGGRRHPGTDRHGRRRDGIIGALTET